MKRVTASSDRDFLRLALRLARRGLGGTAPNPMVGAVLVRRGKILGQGWHKRAGGPHAEIEALQDAHRRSNSVLGATLIVTLEPCCTHGRTPPCTDAILAAGLERVVVGAVDPNPAHAGKGLALLRQAGITVDLLSEAACTDLNAAFNHWIVHGTPFVTVKAAMTLDGKIATARGESKWITGSAARAEGMRLRTRNDAILVGVNTVLADNPWLTVRTGSPATGSAGRQPLRRIVLDSHARTPLGARLVTDDQSPHTTIVVSKQAPASRVRRLARRVKVIVAPGLSPRLNLRWLLQKLGTEGITSLLVEGGGEVNASFLLDGLAHQVAFFYAPKILGGRESFKAVAGKGVDRLDRAPDLTRIRWRRVGSDLMLRARLVRP
jgi:diaminohydroxyphosphoribosylaminopyrimidine deaminase/5-amino-6-(5-phosphoribosylamino)uracil reductase